ncbi:MAG: tol-pal system YbgF family protein [Geoalkalibacter sp.]|uniref:tetratricopeptide repeat protein n=1 Tax=Geoalkalibacter sp. TaxID=3041440 RepID=UPI003D0AEB19
MGTQPTKILTKRRKQPRDLIFAVLLLVIAAALAGTWGYFNQPHQRILRGKAQVDQLLSGQRFAEATRLLRSLQQENPLFVQGADFLLQAGDVSRIHLDQPQRALLDYLLLIQQYPDHPAALKAQRRIADLFFYRLQDYPRAINFYHDLLEAGAPDKDQLHYRLGEAYFRQDNFEQACIEWGQALELYPDSSLVPEILYRLARTRALQGNVDEAIRLYQILTEDHAGDPFAQEGRIGLAAALEEQGRLREALDVLERLQEDVLDSPALMRRIEQVRARMERKKEAI